MEFAIFMFVLYLVKKLATIFMAHSIVNRQYSVKYEVSVFHAARRWLLPR